MEYLLSPDIHEEENDEGQSNRHDEGIGEELETLALSEDEFEDPAEFPVAIHRDSPSPIPLPPTVSTRPKRDAKPPRKYADEQAEMAES